jgi:hypothetical protein
MITKFRGRLAKSIDHLKRAITAIHITNTANRLSDLADLAETLQVYVDERIFPDLEPLCNFVAEFESMFSSGPIKVDRIKRLRDQMKEI